MSSKITSAEPASDPASVLPPPSTERRPSAASLAAAAAAAAAAKAQSQAANGGSPRVGPRILEDVHEADEDATSPNPSQMASGAQATITPGRTPSLGAAARAAVGPPPALRKPFGAAPGLSNLRSQSFSIGQHQDSHQEAAIKDAVRKVAGDAVDPADLAAMDEEMTEEEYAKMIMDRLRGNRSMSTTYANSSPAPSSFASLGAGGRRGSGQADLSTNWRGMSAARVAAAEHRRSGSGASGPPPGLIGGGTPLTPVTTARSALLTPEAAAQSDALRNLRRFSLAPGAESRTMPIGAGFRAMPSGLSAATSFGVPTATTPAQALAAAQALGLPAEYAHLALRRHSLATTQPLPHAASSSAAYKHLSDALEHMHLDEFRKSQYGGLASDDVEEYFDPEKRRKSIADVGKGVPLSTVPNSTPLYIVEFKAGRSDLFYAGDAPASLVKKGDLVIVEADRGKDLGKVVNDSITPLQVQQLQQQQAEIMPELHRANRELHPKRIYRLAQPGEVAMLVNKSQDELKALQYCQSKVRLRKLPMEVVDAEYQWDRRKLTFYFVADHRIDFRELVRELFKVYKTRIWMCAVNPAAATGAVPGVSKPTLPTSPSVRIEMMVEMMAKLIRSWKKFKAMKHNDEYPTLLSRF